MENQKTFDILGFFGGYKMRSLARNGLRLRELTCLFRICKFRQASKKFEPYTRST